ncbi:MAG: hypothetical protein C4555_05840 [Dehalococcoidia bacterium]|nr:MAG: hypothetical protein C4555_05840 [Dehalococcoidia bacterium]
MKKLRILGIGMTFVMLASLFGFAGFTSAAGPGEQQWDYITEPYSAEGYKIYTPSNPVDFVFNGTQGYLLEKGSATKAKVFRSANSGASWSHKSAFNGLGADLSTGAVAIAVAPDDRLSIAATDGINVWISNNEGDTWSKLPAVSLSTNETITDVAVGPARSGLLLAREYAVTVANAGDGSTVGGDVKILGANATWTTVGTTILGTRDYLSVEFSPNYLGDRTLIAVGASATDLDLQTFRIGTPSATLDTQAIITAGLLDLGNTNQVTAGSISIPSDFDPFTAGADVVFVGATVTGGTGDAFRLVPSDDITRDLGLNANIKSVAYGGTVSSGTLFAGYNATNEVKRSADPFSTSPTWTNATKRPTGLGVIVKLDSNYAFNQTVFAVTTVDDATVAPNGRGRTSVSKSEDNGVSFNQYSFVDNGYNSNLGQILDFQFTADESQTFYVVNARGSTAGTTAAGQLPPDQTPSAPSNGDLEVWIAPGTQPTSTSWYKVLTIVKTGSTTNNTALMALNPDWATTPAVYVVDNTATGASTIYVSKNGGATWTTRTGPGTGKIIALLVTDANTIYADVSTKVYKSTNSGAVWEDGVTGSSSANNMIVAPNGELIMGRSGGIYTSTNQGATNWSSNSLGLTSGVNYWVAVDADYANNRTYFVAGDDGSVWRRASADPAWVNISPAAPVLHAYPEIVFGDGVLYVLTTDGVLRNLDYLNQNPASASGAWEKMDAGTTVQFSNNIDFEGALRNLGVYGGNTLKVSTPLDDTFSYRDFLANTKPTLTAPADGFEVSIDPNTGLGLPVNFEWETMGTGNGVPNSFQIEWKEVGGTTTQTTAFGVADIGAPAINSASIGGLTLRANTTYEWRLRVRNTLSGDAVRSVWSDWRSVKVLSGTQVVQTQAGPVLLSPAGGANTGLRPGFSWAPVPNATAYEFILATDAGLTQTVANTPVTVNSPAFQVTSDLAAGTYFWAVKATAPTEGIQSIGSFSAAVSVTPGSDQPDIVVQPPEVTVNVPPIVIPEQTQAPVIDTALVWVVIAIGAILVIAVIVLIVRTRRPV